MKTLANSQGGPSQRGATEYAILVISPFDPQKPRDGRGGLETH